MLMSQGDKLAFDSICMHDASKVKLVVAAAPLTRCQSSAIARA